MSKEISEGFLLYQALQEWKRSIPVNRAARRYQTSKYKYYLELVEDDKSWTVYGIRKNGERFMIDNSVNASKKIKQQKEKEKAITKIAKPDSAPIADNLDGQVTIGKTMLSDDMDDETV